MIEMQVTVTMEEMDGTEEQSAVIAFEQVSEALAGRESEYGWPGRWAVSTVIAIHSPDLEGDHEPRCCDTCSQKLDTAYGPHETTCGACLNVRDGLPV